MNSSRISNGAAQRRVLVYAPIGRYGARALVALREAGLASHACRSMAELVQQLRAGAAAVFSVQEVLAADAIAPLLEVLREQPAWSDLPLLVLVKRGDDMPWMCQVGEQLGNLTLLERPLHAATLVSAVQVALRARARQLQLRVADQYKDEFLAMLAHELRNPLAPISAAVQLLQLSNAGADARARHATGVIVRQVNQLEGLVNHLLDAARMSRGLVVLNKEPLDLREVLAEALEQAGPAIRQRHQNLALAQPDEPVPVLGERKRLLQVLGHLLDNASKYSYEDSHIVVSLRQSPREVTLEVADDGIGMAPDLLARVFEPFTQAQRGADRSQGGLGLGLALVDKLVALHGGQASAASDGPGRGSRLTITLPRHASLARPAVLPLPGPDSRDADTPQLPAPRVLVVDDNADAADMLYALLQAHGYEVAVEYSAARAMERARSFAPRICLLDIGLPDMDGNTLARCLRAQPETRDALLLAVTGYSQPQDGVAALAAGFNEHWVKPVDIDKLLNRLAHVAA
jgi:signal transduction histidine kinase/CheY-like chemotaxis protein